MKVTEKKYAGVSVTDLTEFQELSHQDQIDRLKKLIGKKSYTVEFLADELDVAPRYVRVLVDKLKSEGYRIEDENEIKLQKVAPTSHYIHKSLLDGDEVTLAFVSDTHLNSKECALEHLHLAYDEFEERGITEVYHAGDLVAGRGIYRTQDQDLINFTFDDQVDFAVTNYPERKGIETLIIEGNHDIEGEFGRLGASPVVAFCNRRADAKYLGAYEGTVELPNGAFFQLIHGRGGGSYATSYKPQKWVEGLAAGRKPALVVFGHWHITGFFQHRNVNLLLGACFEWQTKLLVRLGLQPVVGYWLVHLRLGEDGSVVKITPEFTQFFEGRVLKPKKKK